MRVGSAADAGPFASAFASAFAFARPHQCVPVGEVFLATGVRLAGDDAATLRRRRLLRWCRDQRLTPPADVLPFLAHCDSGSEVRFVLALMAAAPGWRADHPTRVVHPARFPAAGAAATLALCAQVPVGRYRIDFVLGPLPASRPHDRIAIEIDGPQHGTARGRQHDRTRQHVLAAAGYHTVRVPARDATATGAALGRALLGMAMDPRSLR